MFSARTVAVALAATAAVFAAAFPLGAQQPPAAQLPPGTGSEIVAVACTQCHGVSAFSQLRMGPEGWRREVEDMVEKGAQLSAADLDTVVTYLSTHLGPGSPFPGQGDHVDLKPGDGAQLVQANCSVCHSVARVIATNRTKPQWAAIVTRMVHLGATTTSDQQKTIVDYLSTRY